MSAMSTRHRMPHAEGRERHVRSRNRSWWGWLVAALVLLALFGNRDIPVLPLIIGFVILSNVLGGRRRAAPRPQGRTEVQDLPGSDWPPPGGGRPAAGSSADPPHDTPMPTIDVPHYPGGGPGARNPYVAVPEPTPPGGAPHTAADPVVSLGQLHLARCGRDLQAAAQHGTATEVARVLDEVRDLSRRMQDMLGAAEGTPGSGRREFQAGLRALDRLVEDARGEHPPGAKLTRVTQTCLRMGQTGRHE